MSFKMRKIDKNSFNNQLILPLTFKTIKNRENFIVSSCNESAIKLIDYPNIWKKETNSIPAAIIYGPKGCGKTHLSAIFKENNNSIYLSELSSLHLDLIKSNSTFVLDNFCPSSNYRAEIVMHFLTNLNNSDGAVLFLSRYSPHKMDWGLEDLNSRIRSLISSEIKVPDDVLLYSFMVKYSNDKKLFLKDKHIFYILQRVERSFEAIINIIDKIDLYSLKNKKKVTYKSIRYVLEN